MLQHSLCFFANLFRIAIVSATGTASVGPTHWFGPLPPLQQLQGPHLPAIALSAVIRSASFHGGRPPKSPRPPGAAEPKSSPDTYLDLCVLCLFDEYTVILTVFAVFVLGNLEISSTLPFRHLSALIQPNSLGPWSFEDCVSYMYLSAE
jgi:hypothetical protein